MPQRKPFWIVSLQHCIVFMDDLNIAEVLEDQAQLLPKNVGFVVVQSHAFDPEEQPEATNMFLDFLCECEIYQQDEIPSIEVQRLLISNPNLKRVSSIKSIPYYDVEFNNKGEYTFVRRKFYDRISTSNFFSES